MRINPTFTTRILIFTNQFKITLLRDLEPQAMFGLVASGGMKWNGVG